MIKKILIANRGIQLIAAMSLMLPSVVLLSGCATATAPRIISQKQADKIAESTWENTLLKSPMAKDVRLQQQVDNVSQSLLSGTDYGHEEWEILVLELSNDRSFSLPANKIAIDSDLVRLSDNEDQLAFVIGALIASSKSDEAINRINRQVFSQALIGSPRIFNSNNSNVQERTKPSLGRLLEYDSKSLELMDKVGFSIEEALIFLQKMKPNSNDNAIALSAARIENIQKYKAKK